MIRRILLFPLLALLAACARQGAPDQPTAENGFSQQVEGRTATLHLSTDRRSLSTARNLRLQLEVVTPESGEVEWPPIEEKLGPFTVAGTENLPPALADGGRVRHGRSYLLEPFLPGDYTIPPLTVQVREKGTTGEPEALASGEFTVAVVSELPADQQDRDIHDIEHSLLPPPGYGAALWSLLAAVLLAGLFFLLRRRRTRLPAAAAPPLPAHERAYAELRRLLAEKLVERGFLKEFYQSVSDILRRYLEHRFGLRAPERTTEEFLAELTATDTLNAAQKALLGQFLQHCDLVKFAALEPGGEDIERTLAACRSVIDQTREGDA
ncbi:MAG: hypothetical protein RBU25_03295 [Lentisphaeria bacterium]|jgi:hypothetical protein|nr:hypothetical protein [Lentisphaeria bacterium]